MRHRPRFSSRVSWRVSSSSRRTSTRSSAASSRSSRAARISRPCRPSSTARWPKPDWAFRPSTRSRSPRAPAWRVRCWWVSCTGSHSRSRAIARSSACIIWKATSSLRPSKTGTCRRPLSPCWYRADIRCCSMCPPGVATVSSARRETMPPAKRSTRLRRCWDWDIQEDRPSSVSRAKESRGGSRSRGR